MERLWTAAPAAVMPIAHDRHARSAFPFSPARRDHGGMMAPTSTALRDGLRVGRVADLTLRGWSGAVRGQVTWPSGAAGAAEPPPLLLCFPDAGDRTGRLARALCAAGDVVVLEIGLRTPPHEPSPAAFHDAVAALEWAADHGAELDADPARLAVAGDRTGGAVAGAMALHARDNWWPAVERQLLVHPVIDAWHPSVPYVSSLCSVPVAGVAPATVVSGGAPRDGGRRYSARLRRAGVEVDELRDDAELPVDLARALRGA